MMKKILLLSSCIWSCLCLFGNPNQRITPEQYIQTYKDFAIREMHRTGIPASITLAQGMLESGNGNSSLATKANNHFGIKCHSGWKGPSMRKDDDKKNECFRKYKSPYESYRDHSEFLTTRQRYAFLFDYKKTDYKSWAKGLKKAGYATNPKYPKLLIDLIDRHQLHKYDRAKDVKVSENKKVKLASVNTEKKEEKKKEDPKEKAKSSGGSIDKSEVIEFSEYKTHKVKRSSNKLNYIIVKKGDTFKNLAKEFEQDPKILQRFNEFPKGKKLQPGQIIYLQPKRSQNKKTISHKAEPGESLWDISQKFGVKMSALYKINNLKKGSRIRAGQVVFLQKK